MLFYRIEGCFFSDYNNIITNCYIKEVVRAQWWGLKELRSDSYNCRRRATIRDGEKENDKKRK